MGAFAYICRFHIMGEDSETNTPRIRGENKRYWCKHADQIHTISEYQSQDSMDPVGTDKAKKVTWVDRSLAVVRPIW